MSHLLLTDLVKRYGEIEVVRDVSLSINEGEFVSLLGPSGCGKTTILRMIAGLIEPTSGAIKVGDRNVTLLPPNKRNIGLVFQSYALFPHMTVFENVAYGLRRKGEKGAAVQKRCEEALNMVRLSGYGERFPRQLSGGQQQRVAMARAIAPRPSVLLFDEPLSNLDAKLRDEMQIELKRLQRELNITTLFVTHDQSEALSMSDRVCVLHEGIIQQFAPPEDIYHRPATSFVASFIGKPNRLSGAINAGTVHISDGLVLHADKLEYADKTAVEVFVRQEAIQLSRQPIESKQSLPGKIALRSFSGAQVQYVITLAGKSEIIVEVASSSELAQLGTGEDVFVNIKPQDVIVLASRSGS